MATTWPQVVTWLMTNLPTITGIPAEAVFDGPPVTGNDPTSYLTVGYVSDDNAGQYTLVRSIDGEGYDEIGHVRCELVVNSGDTNLDAVRTTAFAAADALDARLRADHTLGGVLAVNGVVDLTVAVISVQNQKGAAQALVLTVSYTTTTWP